MDEEDAQSQEHEERLARMRAYAEELIAKQAAGTLTPQEQATIGHVVRSYEAVARAHEATQQAAADLKEGTMTFLDPQGRRLKAQRYESYEDVPTTVQGRWHMEAEDGRIWDVAVTGDGENSYRSTVDDEEITSGVETVGAAMDAALAFIGNHTAEPGARENE